MEPQRGGAAMIFHSFEAAGRLLVEPVRALALADLVVLGLGDEGAGVARPLAEALGAPADLLRVGSLALPWRPRFTFGAVTEDDHHYVDPEIVADVALGAREIAQIARAAQSALRAGVSRRPARPPLQGRAALLVSHALSTGYRALAAAAAAKAGGAAAVIVAAPCAAGDAAERVTAAGARLVTLHVSERPRFDPADFYRVP